MNPWQVRWPGKGREIFKWERVRDQGFWSYAPGFMDLGVQAWGPCALYPPLLLHSVGYGPSFHLSSDRATGSLALSVRIGLPPPCLPHREHHLHHLALGCRGGEGLRAIADFYHRNWKASGSEGGSEQGTSKFRERVFCFLGLLGGKVKKTVTSAAVSAPLHVAFFLEVSQ